MKKRSLSYPWAWITAGVLLILLQGCSGKKIDENNPQDLYENALKDIENDRFLVAIDKLKMIKSKFSYSNYGALAQLSLADVYFKQENFPEAAGAFEAFVELYPKHERTEYAVFKAGESYYRSTPDVIARDLKSAENAVVTFRGYLARFPQGAHAADAKRLKQESFNRLAQKEMMIADFYFKREKWDSARNRLEKILDQYSESDQAAIAREKLLKIPGAVENGGR